MCLGVKRIISVLWVLRMVISVSIDFTLFGVACVFLLLASQNMHSVFKDNNAFDISFCYWLMIVAAVLIPCCWAATPKDFKSVSMLSLLASESRQVVDGLDMVWSGC